MDKTKEISQKCYNRVKLIHSIHLVQIKNRRPNQKTLKLVIKGLKCQKSLNKIRANFGS